MGVLATIALPKHVLMIAPMHSDLSMPGITFHDSIPLTIRGVIGTIRVDIPRRMTLTGTRSLPTTPLRWSIS